MSKRNRIHWFVPTLMVGGLLIGTLLAIGHHLFYRSLNGNPVSDGAFLDSPVSKQQANIAIGTALAFLVKACLVFAVSLAFIQVFWTVARVRLLNRPPKLEALDSAYGSFENFWAMFNLVLWWKYPLLLAIASMAWLVPIASIITPATLSIQSAPIVPSRTALMQMPSVGFRSMNFVTLMETDTSSESCYTYDGPSEAVRRTTNAVVAQGPILPLNLPLLNASWHADFAGPSLKCDHVSGSKFDKLRTNLIHGNSKERAYYAAWFPNSHGNKQNNETRGFPFYEPPPQSLGIPAPRFSQGSLVASNNDDLAFHVAVMPQYKSILNATTGASHQLIRNLTVVECRLVNSTYRTSFNYTNGVQDISAKVEYIDPDTTLGSIQKTCANQTYFGLSNNNRQHYSCPASERTCFYNPNFFQMLSYQAIMDAFTRPIAGKISLSLLAEWTISTNVLNTILIQTSDMINIRTGQIRRSGDDTWGRSLQGKISNLGTFDKPEFHGLENFDNSSLVIDLPNAIEQLFQNVTISMMASKVLQPNPDSLTPPEPVNVTYHDYHNIYVYSAWKLWIPYGIGIGLVLLTVLVGLVTMLRANASYNDDFSTIFRAARGAKISEEVRDEDLDGTYPLPKYLKNAEVTLPRFDPSIRPLPKAGYQPVVAAHASLDVSLPSDQASSDSGLLESVMHGFHQNMAGADRSSPVSSVRSVQPPMSSAPAIPRRPVGSNSGNSQVRQSADSGSNQPAQPS